VGGACRLSFVGEWEEEVEIADGEEDVGEEVVEENDINDLSEQKPRVIFDRKVLKMAFQSTIYQRMVQGHSRRKHSPCPSFPPVVSSTKHELLVGDFGQTILF
jgi:hypothetical protein